MANGDRSKALQYIDTILALVAALAIIAVLLYMVIWSKSFEQSIVAKNFQFALAFALAIFGGTITGLLNVRAKLGNAVVRASGAMGLFVLGLFGPSWMNFDQALTFTKACSINLVENQMPAKFQEVTEGQADTVECPEVRTGDIVRIRIDGKFRLLGSEGGGRKNILILEVAADCIRERQVFQSTKADAPVSQITGQFLGVATANGCRLTIKHERSTVFYPEERTPENTPRGREEVGRKLSAIQNTLLSIEVGRWLVR